MLLNFDVSVGVAGYTGPTVLTELHRFVKGSEYTKFFKLTGTVNKHGLDYATFIIDKRNLSKFRVGLSFIIYIDDKPLYIGTVSSVREHNQYAIEVQVKGYQHRLQQKNKFIPPLQFDPFLPTASIKNILIANATEMSVRTGVLFATPYFNIPEDVVIQIVGTEKTYTDLFNDFINILNKTDVDTPPGYIIYNWDVVPFEETIPTDIPVIRPRFRFYAQVINGSITGSPRNYDTRATLFLDHDFFDYAVDKDDRHIYNKINIYDKIAGVNSLVDSVDDQISISVYGEKRLDVFLEGHDLDTTAISLLADNILQASKSEREIVRLKNVQKINSDGVPTYDSDAFTEIVGFSFYNISLDTETDVTNLISLFNDLSEWDTTGGGSLIITLEQTPVNGWKSYKVTGAPSNNIIEKIRDDPILNPKEISIYFKDAVTAYGNVYLVASASDSSQELMFLKPDNNRAHDWSSKTQRTDLKDIVKFQIYFLGDIQIDKLTVLTDSSVFYKRKFLIEKRFTFENTLTFDCVFGDEYFDFQKMIELYSGQGDVAFNNLIEGVV
jgi:hypothetical protein